MRRPLAGLLVVAAAFVLAAARAAGEEPPPETFELVPPVEGIPGPLFYGTPILYSISVVIDKAGIEVARLMLVNPVATAIQQARHAMVDTSYEGVGQIFGTSAGFLIPISVAVITFVAGLFVFNRAAPHIAEQL